MGKAKRRPRIFQRLGNWLCQCRRIHWRKSWTAEDWLKPIWATRLRILPNPWLSDHRPAPQQTWKLHSLHGLQWPHVTEGGTTTPKQTVKSICADWLPNPQFLSTPIPIWLTAFGAPKTLAGHYWVSKKKRKILFYDNMTISKRNI